MSPTPADAPGSGAPTEASLLVVHALPRERHGDPDGYIDAVVDAMLPAVAGAGLAAFCDVPAAGDALTLFKRH